MSISRKILPGVSKLIEQLKLSMLPSGTVCWFYLTEVPYGWRLCDGTNGTPNLIGRYAVGSISNIGQLVEAGLPNIRGSFFGENYAYGNWDKTLSGAFYQDSSGSDTRGLAVDWDRDNKRTMFNASRCSDVYGKSETVTPPSTKLLPCMKI